MKFLCAALLLVPLAAQAENRFGFEPSIEIKEVVDNNLNFSDEAPVSDRFRRVTPALALKFDSPRLTARGTYGFDAETFATHSDLDDSRARQQAGLGVRYAATPRLALSITSAYIDTNNLSELNADTGLGLARTRAKQTTFSPSMRYQLSPRSVFSVSASSIGSEVSNGTSTDSQVQRLAFERQVTSRDQLTLDYEHGRFNFENNETDEIVNTDAVRLAWSHDLTARTRWLISAGPRQSNGTPTTDFTVSSTHRARYTSFGISLMQGQTTIVGRSGVVDTRSLQAKFNYEPNRHLTAYVAPAFLRSKQGDLRGDVFRLSVGTRYALNSMIDIDVAYRIEKQEGAIDAARSDVDISHSMLTVGFATRWSKQ